MGTFSVRMLIYNARTIYSSFRQFSVTKNIQGSLNRYTSKQKK